MKLEITTKTHLLEVLQIFIYNKSSNSKAKIGLYSNFLNDIEPF